MITGTSKLPHSGFASPPVPKPSLRTRRGTRKTLGHYPAISLQEARRRFFALKATTDMGGPQISFQQARSEFLAQDKWKPSSRKEMTRVLMRHFHWDKPLDRITSNDVSTVIDRIAAPKEALHALAAVKAFFNWCVPRYLKYSPCTGLKPSSRRIPRERLLTSEELARTWRAAEMMGTYGRHVQLYPVHVMTRKSFGLMTRKLSVTESQRSAQFPGTFSRRKLSVASANCAQVA